MTAAIARAMTVKRETSWKTATMIASAAAIQRAIRVRRDRSQRPDLLVPCSIACDESMSRVNRTTQVRSASSPRPPPARAARPPDVVEGSEERRAAVVEAGGAVAKVERGVDGSRRQLLDEARDEEHDPEVLRQVEWLEDTAVPRPELRAVDEEERDVGAEARRDLAQVGVRQWPGERRVREPERGSGIGTA